jgi:hypothetical protein
MRVLRGLLALAAVVMSVGAAQAQTDTPKFGVFGGFNHSYFATTEGGEAPAKQGGLFGAFAVIRRDKAIKIQPEVQLSQRRVQVIYAGTETTYSTMYVNLALNVRMNLFKGIYSTQGPQFSFPVRARLQVPGASADIKDNIASDFSLIVGVGKQFGRIGVEGRWDAGFKRVEKIPLGGFIKRNRAITFMAIVGL